MSQISARSVTLFTRSALAASLGGLALATGCGSDDEKKSDTSSTTTEQTAPATTPERADSTATDDGRKTTTSPPASTPSDTQGDEQPIRSNAVFTGRTGRVGPKVVRVPPFFAIRVVLKSADGVRYSLSIGGKTLAVDPAKRRATAQLAGIRPGGAYTGKVTEGTGAGVRIEASSEPGE